MKTIKTYTVSPRIPENLEKLNDVMYNLWWSWTPSAIALFDRMDRSLWHTTHHSPTLLLSLIKQDDLQGLSEDPIFLSNLELVHSELEDYLNQKTWFKTNYNHHKNHTIAYFSLEFGIHECLPIYSGGLGVLAGDHLKSASELGLPLVGVGLIYEQGYFTQQLTRNGWQHELYPKNDFRRMPITLELDENNNPLLVSVLFPYGEVFAQIWNVKVGRINLYLLDTNTPKNNKDDRLITSHLYGGNQETRLRQEMILGIGGLKALNKLGINPSVCHANEGHASFMFIERTHNFMVQHNLSLLEAKQLVASSSVFTTHTPVPAGIDRFPKDLVKNLMDPYFSSIGIPLNTFLKIASKTPELNDAPVNMAILALNMAYRSNAVSELHGKVSRKMWNELWPQLPSNEVPIKHITNGVHLRTWISDEISKLFDRYIGPRWAEDPVNTHIWERVTEIPDSELWISKGRLRHRLVSFARKKLKTHLMRANVPSHELTKADEILNPDALTIGFARRFATYKRATLLFSDMERLKKILLNPEKPVQLVIAGKAHPQDNEGKEFIRQIVKVSNDPDFFKNVVFIENYDIAVARYLVQGVDIWLNNPRRPMEASGTSGMKVPVNGGINLSILDGWWPEAYNGSNGWAIGEQEEFIDQKHQDIVESQILYNILENEVIPRFYFRDVNNIPRDWLITMKESMRTICPAFNTNRMLKEYSEQLYIPCLEHHDKFHQSSFTYLKEFVEWKEKIFTAWEKVKITAVRPNHKDNMQVGDSFSVEVDINLGSSSENDISVEILCGELDRDDKIEPKEIFPLNYHVRKNNICTFAGNITNKNSGRYGFTVRLRPYHSNLSHPHELGLTYWW